MLHFIKRVEALINFHFQTTSWQTPRADCVHFSLIPKTQINNAGPTWLTAVFLELAEELAFFCFVPKNVSCRMADKL